MADIFKVLADHVVKTQYNDIPEKYIGYTKLNILDSIGTLTAGFNSSGCQTIVDLVKEWGGKEESSVMMYGGKVPAHNAAMANAVMARALDFDDAEGNGMHPSAALMPVAMAVSESLGGVSGRELLTAVTLGADVAGRINYATLEYHGFDPTITALIFGTTTVAGKLFGLNEEQMWNALGLAFNECSGTFQANVDGVHSVRINQGLCACEGIMAAQMAKRSITGVKNIAEGVYGYFHLFSNDKSDLKHLTKNLGKVYYGEKTIFKRWPSCGMTLAATDIAMNLVEERRYILREISINDLNAELANATCHECNVTLQVFHHDVTPLPNGHWLVLANTIMNLSESTVPVLNNASTPVAVLGDVIVDLDQNLQPVWAWNEFNHLDVNRQPMMFPDWTHSNAIIYSPDDKDILVSIRHQNWVVKINYDNGAGSGNIVWELGEGGTFTLEGANGITPTDPTDWQYAQHGPAFFSTNTSGVFSLGLMDNGDDREFPVGVTCGSTGAPPCAYSTVPVFQINENSTPPTATLTFHLIEPTALYNNWGGNTQELSNNDVEFDLCGVGSTGSYVYEVTQDQANTQTVWSLTSAANLYRAYRMPSLYPNVQW